MIEKDFLYMVIFTLLRCAFITFLLGFIIAMVKKYRYEKRIHQEFPRKRFWNIIKNTFLIMIITGMVLLLIIGMICGGMIW